MRRGGRIGLVVGASLLTATVARAEGPAVAVFPIRVVDVPKLEKKNLDKFTDLLETIVASESYPTIPRSEIQARIADQSATSFETCYDEACQIELGKAVAAQKALSTSYAGFGETCLLTFKLYDLKKALTEFSTTHSDTCDESGLMRSITAAGKKLGEFGKGGADPVIAKTPAPPPPVRAAPPPPPATTPPEGRAEIEEPKSDEGLSTGAWIGIGVGVGAVVIGVVVLAVVLGGGSDDPADSNNTTGTAGTGGLALTPGLRF